MSRLFIVDGYGIIYRSYFAFISRPLTDGKGNNVSAVFGFFKTLMMIVRDYRPDYLVVALDAPERTFRHELFPEYKANREAAPEDLHAQVPVITGILEHAGIPYRMQPGMEADDIIATFCSQARLKGIDSVIVTGDKDLMQLVGPGVQVLRPPRKGEDSYVLCSEEQVPNLYGVRPDQIVDYLTILGDSSDNVPGIKGLGAKGAEKLLSAYGTLDNVYEHLDELTPSVRAKLEEGRLGIGLSRTLIRLKNDLFTINDFSAELCPADSINWAGAAEDFTAINSKSLAAQAMGLSAQNSSGPAAPADPVTAAPAPAAPDADDDDYGITMSANPDYRPILSIDELDRILKEAVSGGLVALDTETTDLDPTVASLVGISFCSETGRAYYIPLVCGGERLLEEAPVLDCFRRNLKGVGIIGQNIKYDLQILSRAGLELKDPVFDTMIAAWLLDSDSGVYNMDALAERLLSYKTVRFEDVVPKGGCFSDVALADAVRYAAEDSDVTWTLYRLLSKKLEGAGLDGVLREIEMPLVRILARMELNGILLDRERIASLSGVLEAQREAVASQVFELCGKEFNLNSPKQLSEVLFVDRNLKPGKKTRTGFSTDSDVLEGLAATSGDPVPGLILRSRFLSKLNSYCSSLPDLISPADGRIHPDFLQTGTGTGRLSCRNPNLQNIPVRTDEGRLIRGAFPAAEGCTLMSVDYSQIELVVLAHLSGDPALTEAFRSGDDVHRATAARIFGGFPEFITPEQRRIAKTINFGVIYGMSPFRLSNELGIGWKQAQGFIDSYFSQYGGVRAFVDSVRDQASQTLSVKTMFGHIRRVPQIGSANKVERAGGERIAVNTVVQGTAAEIMKKAMVAVDKALRESSLDARLLLQIHDELIFEVPVGQKEATESLVRRVMENVVTLSVPLKCSIEFGDDWGQMH